MLQSFPVDKIAIQKLLDLHCMDGTGREREYKNMKHLIMNVYVCDPQKIIRKRALKSQGSCKMFIWCTSRIIVSKNIETDCCAVTYFKTHYGHDDDIEHLHKYQNQINISSKFILRLSSKIKLQTVQDSIIA
ncbi:uncharacterized protein LOC126885821 [Diabrotica virgifera virgifera]|uniref:Uncharacterized protein n=1 Tax=Diabrotica virgifera virgifera TaxID=50390 RepID=A0ABM5KED2_DIAVI|nr:uncharacterized protein LOC126885821 [Diabrotica virgifera virgifera]